MNKKIKNIIIIIVIVLVIESIMGTKEYLSNRVSLEELLKNNEVKESVTSTFALMIEQSDGTYKESNNTKWPTNMKFNSELSKCTDANGNEINNVLSYDNNTKLATVNTTTTTYCYLYFDMKPYCNDNEILGECLLENNSEIDSLNDNVEGGLYRYQGTNTLVNDNYICFGTSDKSTCLNNTDKYMYRIIGIDENKQIKLIKNTSIGNYMWYSVVRTDVTWPESDLFKGLNGIEGGYYTDLFVNNSTYTYMKKNSDWYNKIADISWKYGDTLSNGDYNGDTIYKVENGWTETVNAKIGLMYIHDYYYAYAVGGTLGDFLSLRNAWIYHDGNWTLSHIGFYEEVYPKSWYADYFGVSDLRLDSVSAVYPVFYLVKDTKFSNGIGELSNPFIIKE